MGCKAQTTAIAQAMARICNAADRPRRGCDAHAGLVQRRPNSAEADVHMEVIVIPGEQPAVPRQRVLSTRSSPTHCPTITVRCQGEAAEHATTARRSEA
uniref:Uncharacterized protein n=1 Tax=mine drainage metagenome TaxID=410659 RepID=E6PVS5_9ZZZZ